MYARKLENKRESQISTITTHCMTDHSEENGYECHISEAWEWSEVTQSCPTLCDPVDCSPPGSSVHGILQVRIPEWVAISFSRGSSRSRDWTQVSFVAGRRFNHWATREAPVDPLKKAMAAHSSVLAWRIPGTGEPGGLLSVGSHRVGHD